MEGWKLVKHKHKCSYLADEYCTYQVEELLPGMEYGREPVKCPYKEEEEAKKYCSYYAQG